MHASPTQVIFNGSGERICPHSTSPFRRPHLPNQPRVLLVFGGVDLPASARASTQPAAATRPLRGRPRGVETCPGEVMRRRAAERTSSLLGAALLPMGLGLGLGCASGCGVGGEMQSEI